MSNQEQAYMELDALQRRIQRSQQRSSYIQESILELQQAKQALEGLQADDEILVPLGGGVQAPAKLPDGPVITPIGAGYAVEEDRESAGRRVDERIQELSDALQSVHEDIEALVNKARQIQQQLSEAAPENGSSADMV